MAGPKETKVFPGHTLALNAETGVIDAYVSISGILDDDRPPDRILSGAFRKTIAERGPAGSNRIRVLWQHMGGDVIGRPLSLQEHTRDQMPPEILAQWPDTAGGLFAQTQMVMDVQRGREAVALYKAGAMKEWSIGFDSVLDTMSTINAMPVRDIQEIRLWEYSPVTWGMNPATTTTNVKTLDDPALAKVKELALLLKLPADAIGDPLKVLAEIEKRLKGAEPPSPALTPRTVAQLRAEIDLQRLRLTQEMRR